MRKTLLLAAALLATAAPAGAYIEALQNLQGLLNESHVVARGTVDRVSAERKVLILKVGKAAKGKPAYERIRIDLNPGEGWHPDAVLRHAVAGAPVSIFYAKGENTDQAALSLIHLNRFFMVVKAEEPVWRLTKIETGMSRAFSGTSEELNDLVIRILSGRTKAPAPRTDLRPWTRETLEALPPPPAEGGTWAAFDVAAALAAKKSPAPDAEGFLQNWLAAGPLKDSGRPEGVPKEGGKVGDSAWTALLAADYAVDLSAGKGSTDALFHGATWIFCDQETSGLRLASGSDEASVWWINGEELLRTSGTALAKDQATSKPFVLRKGSNLLQVAVTNKAGAAQACARFLDQDGKPFRGFTHDSAPR